MRSLAIWRSDVLSRFGVLALTSLVLLTTPAFSAVDHDAILRDRLNDVRELLDRRQAYRSLLTGRIERFSLKLDRLQSEREAALQALAEQEDRARAYERELDRLMPRLLPRLGLLDQFRKNGARTIAGLAAMERSTDLKDRTRSRLLAAQTASIEQMRRASTAVRLLRRVPNALTARHRDVDFQIPLLAASANRLDLKQSQLQRRRDAAIRDLADLAVDIERLTVEEHRLARNMIARSLEVTDRADVEPSNPHSILLDRRGLGKSTIGGADVRGFALRQTQPTPVARPLTGIGARSRIAAAASARPDDAAALSAKSQASALLAGWSRRKKPWAADLASLNAAPTGSSLAARVNSGRIDSSQALVPAIETIGFTASGDHAEIEIAALPRQQVAAPGDGRVAFAGDFRSYGLLLIIEHGNEYHTLLWGFSSLDIEVGDTVQAGQIIGIVKDEPSPKLHIELRRNGQPVSPEVWLAASNSGVKG
ncbi:MAG: murein hydrolase activator EnvC family protein [Geminicoccaceae bacterium]